MKKTLIALAALAAVTTSFAQSTVTIYGTLDVGYGAGTVSGANKDLAMASAYDSTSKIGFKGTEDMGGGMAAGFNFETGGLNMTTGATALDTSRASNISLSGGFGKVTLGRIAAVAAQGTGAYDLNGTASSSAYVRAGLSPVVWYGSSRRSSQLQYSTNLGPVSVLLGDTLSSDNGNQFNRFSAALGYAAGPLSLGLTAEGASTNAAGARTAVAVSAKYNLGAAVVSGQYVQSEFDTQANSMASYAAATAAAKVAGGDPSSYGQGFGLGVSVPMGAATIGAQFARNGQARTDGTTLSALELFAKYALSKRTTAYFEVAAVSNDNTGANNAYNVGIVHGF